MNIRNPHAITRIHKDYIPPSQALLESVAATVHNRRREDKAQTDRIRRLYFWYLQAPGLFVLGALVDRVLLAWGIG